MFPRIRAIIEISTVLLVLITAITIAAGIHAQQPPGVKLSAANQRTVDDIVALETEKQGRSKTDRKIDSQLLQAIAESRGQRLVSGVDLEPVNIGQTETGRVTVDIAAVVSDDLVTQIEGLGGTIILPSWEYGTIRAEVDLSMVSVLAQIPQISFIEPAVGSMTSRASGQDALQRPTVHQSFEDRAAAVKRQLNDALTSLSSLPGPIAIQGDVAHRANTARNSYGYAGLGVRIGVLSDSFNRGGGANSDILAGALPGPGNPFGNLTPVTVVQEKPTSGADEGRAMMQIVHAVAPKAQLYFATADMSEGGFASNITALRSAPYNCDIIIDDVFYFDESPFQDGPVAQAVNTVTASGALYFSSAGNEGSVAKLTAGYFESDFDDAGSLAFTFPGGAKSGTVHNFGTVAAPVNGDVITGDGEDFTLTWADPAGAASDDYDLFIVTAAGTVKSSSTNIQNGTQNPFEQIVPPTFGTGDRLVVFKTAAAAPVAFALNSLRGGLANVTTGQTHGHSAAVSAFSVAAAPAADAFNASYPTGPYPNAFSASSQLELFTSDGPRRVFFNADGSAITPGNFKFATNGGAVRQKPDITAADGVPTTGTGMGTGLNPFYGTSAAAPHAGAIAALYKSANPALSAAQIRSILTSTALDVESPGYDNLSGFGIVQAFQGMQAVSPSPQSNVVLGTVTVGEGSFGNGNGNVDPGEIGTLNLQLTDPATLAATGVVVTVTTSTPGISMILGTSSYGTIGAGANATNPVPITFAVNGSVLCGTTINFVVNVAYGGGQSPQQFVIAEPVGSVPYLAIHGTLGTTPPTLAGVTSTSGQQTGRINRSGVQSTCASPRPNPGLTATVGARQFDAYTFQNTSQSSQCVQVTMTSPNGANLYTASFSAAGFVPATPNTNFLADPGSSTPTQTYSFTVAAGAAFTVVVHDLNTTPTSGSAYTLSVGLANCSTSPSCSAITVTPGTIVAAAPNVPYSQTFGATGGSSNYSFAQTGALPTGLSFSANVISGTPTQTGTFPISVTANDLAGCPSASANYSLVVSSGSATVDGKVIGADGRALKNATVTISNSGGVPHVVLSSSLGFFSFSDLPTGGSYTVRVSSKRYRFSAQNFQLNGALTLPTFMGSE